MLAYNYHIFSSLSAHIDIYVIKVPYVLLLLFFPKVRCRLFFDDLRHSFEMVRLLNTSSYYQRAVNNCMSMVFDVENIDIF